jgi:hypothetical protein
MGLLDKTINKYNMIKNGIMITKSQIKFKYGKTEEEVDKAALQGGLCLFFYSGSECFINSQVKKLFEF